MSQQTNTGETKAAAETVTLPADELKAILLGYDDTVKKAAAVIADQEKKIAELTQKTASTDSTFSDLRQKAAEALVKHKIISPEDKQKAVDKMASFPDAVALLTNALNPELWVTKPIGQVTKAASTVAVDTTGRGRMNENPAARAEVNGRYMSQLGLG